MLKTEIADRTKEWLRCLRKNGYRLTAPRKAVVEIMASSHFILTPTDIFMLARERYPKLGLVTVYRTIEKLEELGLIQRVHRPSGCQGFIAGYQGHQHMLICQNCGLVQFFDGDHVGINDLMKDVEGRTGYTINEHWLQLFGVCKKCRQKST
jgi:Fur family transcriptional regulator, ferric uptake regulator